MEDAPMNLSTRKVVPTPAHLVELERLGDEIAKLSAHLDAATARLLDLIREFDARGGWGNGFASCAAWLTWRIGLDPGAARERVRVARALGSLPRLAQAHRPGLAPGRSYRRSAGEHSPPPEPHTSRVSRRRRYGRHPRASGTGGGGRPHEGAGGRPGSAGSAPTRRSRGNATRRTAAHGADHRRRPADAGPAAGRCPGPHRRDGAPPRH